MCPQRTILRDLRGDPRLVARFWLKVNQREPLFCWEWTAYRARRGYGKIGIKGRVHFAHRVAWALTFGPIPEGTHVLHRCDNPPCCNPDHLFLGTQTDNMHDMWGKGRHGMSNPLGESSHLSKLTVADVRRIRALGAAGVLQRDIAAQFGVSQTNVGLILRRRTWSHI